MTWSAAVRIVLALAALLVASAGAAKSTVEQSNPAKTVVAIFTGPENHPSNLALSESIQQALAAPPETRIDLLSEYLDAEGIDAPNAVPALEEYIARKYRARHIDVVIAPSDAAMQFVLANREHLFPDASIVWSGVEDPTERARAAGLTITGVQVGVAYAETLKLALGLHPAVKQVFIVAKTTGGLVSRAALQNEFAGAPRDVTLTFVDKPTIPELLTAVRAIPSGSLILYLWHQPNDASNFIYPDTVARLVAEAANVPVYGTSDFYTGLGVVGGVVRLTRETGTRLGQMTRSLLDGKHPEDIPIEHARLVPIFDWRQLRRWGIDEFRLPAGSDVRFRVPTVWEAYGGYIAWTVVIVAAQLVLIVALLVQSARRRRAEQVVEAREAALSSSYQRIRRLAGRLIHAQEAARSSIARDLHDDFCQQLALVGIEISAFKQSHGSIEDPRSQEALDGLERHTQSMLDGVRRLSHDLHPASLRILGLGPALKTYLSEMANRQNVRVSFTSEGDLAHVNPDVSVCLFRITQEAVRNGVVHGHSQQFTVTLTRSGDSVNLTIADDGHGFDLESVRAHGGGLGLVSMEERAHVVGGTVEVVTGVGRGTTIRVHCPADLPDRESSVDERRARRG